MNQYEAPHTNGIVEGLAEEQILSIKEKLKAIQNEFSPSYEQPVCDTFYLVVEYTKAHDKEEGFIRVNGDTAEYCLAYEPAEKEGE